MARSTVIGPQTRVLGALFGEDDLVIEGIVEGAVHGHAMVILAASAQVSGEIRAREISIAGIHRHDVFASEMVHLAATAELVADIEAPRVAIDEGARFEGRVRMPHQTPAKAVSAPVATAARVTPTQLVATTPTPLVATTPTPLVAPTPTPARVIPALATPGKQKLVRKVP